MFCCGNRFNECVEAAFLYDNVQTIKEIALIFHFKRKAKNKLMTRTHNTLNRIKRTKKMFLFNDLEKQGIDCRGQEGK